MSELSVDQFRAAFPSFCAAEFPDAAVSARLKIADKFFSEDVWDDDDVRVLVMGLYTAHFLTAYGSQSAGGTGTSGGTGTGIVSSKGVDGASVSYDTSSSSESNAGFWNASSYGRELWQLMRVFGCGAVQL